MQTFRRGATIKRQGKEWGNVCGSEIGERWGRREKGSRGRGISRQNLVLRAALATEVLRLCRHRRSVTLALRKITHFLCQYTGRFKYWFVNRLMEGVEACVSV